MTTITVTFSGRESNLRAAELFIHFASSIRYLTRSRMVATYHCETNDRDEAIQDVMDSIGLESVEAQNCTVLSLV